MGKIMIISVVVGFVIVAITAIVITRWWEDNHCPITKGKHQWEQWGKKNWCIYECLKCGCHKHSYKDLTVENETA